MRHSPQERVLRRYVKQVMMESQVGRPSVRPPPRRPRRPVNEVLLRSLIREQLMADGFRVMTDWEVVREWAHRPAGLNEWGLPGRDLLAEGIVDEFLDGVGRAVDWVQDKVGEAVSWSSATAEKAMATAQQKAGELKSKLASGAELVKKGVVIAMEKIEEFMAAGKVVAKDAYEKVGGVFEMLKTFSGDAIDAGMKAVTGLFTKFMDWVKDNYESLLKSATKHVNDPRISDKLKELAGQGESDAKEVITKCIESPKEAVKVLMGNSVRGIAGKIVKGIMQLVFYYFKEVPEGIKKMLLGSELAAGLGMKGLETALRLLFVAVGSMEGTSAYVSNGLKVYKCVKDLGERAANDDTLEIDVDIEAPDGTITTVGPETDMLEAIVSLLPDAMLGIISGKNLAELSARIGFGDPTALVELLGKTIKIILKTFMKIVEKNMPDILEKCGIDPKENEKTAALLTWLIPEAMGFAVEKAAGKTGGS